MVGIERSIFPQFALEKFGLSSHAAILSFVAAFGLSKAIANYYAGKLAQQAGRKKILTLGWLLALPVPFLLIYAPTWNWVVFANVLLGIHQGLAWSSTVIMKIDLAGPKERGLAMGLNEFAGYLAVGLSALLAGIVADRYGVSPYPFYLGLGIAIAGLALTIFTVRDTSAFVEHAQAMSSRPAMKQVFFETSFTDKTLHSVTQAGLINNLNDGMIWGLLPSLLIQLAYSGSQIGWITGLYPMVWGISQLLTGRLSDIWSKKSILFLGMLIQGLGIMALPYLPSYEAFLFIAVMLGLGTALVYPTFLATVAKVSPPLQRAETLGVFRFWRDSGYTLGAISSGLIADWAGISVAIVFVGVLTLLSAFWIQIWMPSNKSN